MKNELCFRPVNESDGKSLYLFFTSLSEKSKATFQPHPFTREFAKKIANDFSSNLRIRIVAVINDANEIAGYAFLHRLPVLMKDGYFGIAVSDKHQKKGIGSSLLKYLLKYAKKKGVKHILLNVYAHNIKAIAVYQKQGFEIHSPSLLLRKLITLNELIYNRNLLKLISKNKNESNDNQTEHGKPVWMKKDL